MRDVIALDFVVVDKIFFSGVVRRINVNHIDPFLVREVQNSKRVVVITLNQQMHRLVFVAADLFALHFLQNRERLPRNFIGENFTGRAGIRIDVDIIFFRRIPMPDKAVFRVLDAAQLLYQLVL